MPKRKPKRLEKLVKFLEKELSTKVKLGLAAAALVGLIITGTIALQHLFDTVPATVMITNTKQSSGGSGVIMYSTYKQSAILTNNHICDVIKNGGYVKRGDEKYTVTYYIPDTLHDVCMVYVSADLGVETNLASRAAELYEPATISGHPGLLPTVVSYGHFAKREIIRIITDIRRCGPKDYNNRNTAPICTFFGVVPIFTSYESTVVTATIMGGSSGSGIYNSTGEISGLVFAGNGKGLSFAYAVPYEYVAQFLKDLDNEYNEVTGRSRRIYPSYERDLGQLIEEMSLLEHINKIRLKCKDVSEKTDSKVHDICASASSYTN